MTYLVWDVAHVIGADSSPQHRRLRNLHLRVAFGGPFPADVEPQLPRRQMTADGTNRFLSCRRPPSTPEALRIKWFP